MRDGRDNDRLNLILDALRDHPLAQRFHIAGSLAQGCRTPGDVDLVIDLRDRVFGTPGESTGRETLRLFSDVLRLAGGPNYGLLDPFCLFKDRLITRNDDATGWQYAANARALRASLVDDMVPLWRVEPLPAMWELDGLRKEDLRPLPKTPVQTTQADPMISGPA